jgi:hypothetical protein
MNIKVNFDATSNTATIESSSRGKTKPLSEPQFIKSFPVHICDELGFSDKVRERIQHDIQTLFDSNPDFKTSLEEMKSAGMLK